MAESEPAAAGARRRWPAFAVGALSLRGASVLAVRRSTLLALALLLVGTAWRFWIAAQHVESPMIDENEVAEQAVAFMGGELRYHFLKYGPLSMYVLAGIYRVMAFLHGTSALDYASRVFFEGSEHYLIARWYMVGSLSVLGAASFFSLRRNAGLAPALLGLTLLSFPFLEVMAPGARIDMPQAALQGLTLLCLYEVVGAPARLRWWLLAGACAGFAIATKPLPGLLVTPSFALAAWFGARTAPDGSPRELPQRLLAALATRGMWLAVLPCLACAALGNPAMLDIQHFVTSQREAVALHSGQVTWSQQGIGESLLMLRWPFVIALGASVGLALFQRDPRALLSLLFMLLYLGAFYGRASRKYYLVAAAAGACLVVAHGWAALGPLSARLAERWRKPSARVLQLGWAALGALLVLPLAIRLTERASEPSLATESLRWISEHIPAGSRIYYVGWRPAGPQLVADDERLQASFGDHFDYGRDHYKFLRRAFHQGYLSYVESGKPRYALTVHGAPAYSRSSNKTPREITDKLLRRARKQQIPYIIIGGYKDVSLQALAYPWFAKATLLAEFGKTAIFAVPPAAPATAVAPEMAPAATGQLDPDAPAAEDAPAATPTAAPAADPETSEQDDSAEDVAPAAQAGAGAPSP